MRTSKDFSNFIPWIEIIVDFWSQKLAHAYYQRLESTIHARLNPLILIIALNTRTCVTALLIPTWSKLSPNLIDNYATL